MGVEMAKLGAQFDSLIKKLKTLEMNFSGGNGSNALVDVIQKTVHMGLDIITDEIHHVRPHSGKHRLVPQDTVTDLIDTGHYINSWVVSHSSPVSAKISTNSEYALPLEFGKHDPELVKPYTRSIKKGKLAGKTLTVRAHIRNTNMKGFHVATKAAVKIRKIFKEEIHAAIKKILEDKK